jgi:hypothetical protein
MFRQESETSMGEWKNTQQEQQQRKQQQHRTHKHTESCQYSHTLTYESTWNTIQNVLSKHTTVMTTKSEKQMQTYAQIPIEATV